MLRKFKENLFKWWISVNTGCLNSHTCWYFERRVGELYFSFSEGVRASIGGDTLFISNCVPETKEEFVNAVYKHLTDGTTN